VPFVAESSQSASSAILTAAVAVVLIATVFAVVFDAEVVAHRIGESFGTLVFALTITVIEVALIVPVILPFFNKQPRKGYTMKRLMLGAAFLAITSIANAQTSTVTPLYSHDLGGIPGKEGLMLTVSFAPAGSDPIHRHDANVFVYVLEGSIVMQVKGEAPVTLHPGQTFYEAPTDIHLIGRNASKTEPAKFLVFFVKDKGVPPVLPVK